MSADSDWPQLDWAAWRDTAIGLQLRAQIVGKVRLALTPWLNHSWHVPFYLTARGWTTSAIPCGSRILQIDFDLIGDAVTFATSNGAVRSIPTPHYSPSASRPMTLRPTSPTGIAMPSNARSAARACRARSNPSPQRKLGSHAII